MAGADEGHAGLEDGQLQVGPDRQPTFAARREPHHGPEQRDEHERDAEHARETEAGNEEDFHEDQGEADGKDQQVFHPR
jgi:hypothetical protein